MSEENFGVAIPFVCPHCKKACEAIIKINTKSKGVALEVIGHK